MTWRDCSVLSCNENCMLWHLLSQVQKLICPPIGWAVAWNIFQNWILYLCFICLSKSSVCSCRWVHSTKVSANFFFKYIIEIKVISNICISFHWKDAHFSNVYKEYIQECSWEFNLSNHCKIYIKFYTKILIDTFKIHIYVKNFRIT